LRLPYFQPLLKHFFKYSKKEALPQVNMRFYYLTINNQLH
jgi:hypothetical protein